MNQLKQKLSIHEHMDSSQKTATLGPFIVTVSNIPSIFPFYLTHFIYHNMVIVFYALHLQRVPPP